MRNAEGDQAVFNGDWETAKNAFQLAQAGSSDPAIQVAALTGLGKTYLMSGDDLNALNTLRNLVESYPTSPDAAEGYFLLGQVYSNLQRPADAAAAYQSYLDLRPGILDAYVQELRGDALAGAGDNNGALSAYLASLAAPRQDSSIPLEIKIAQTYAALGDHPTALLMYDDIYQRANSDYTKAQIDLLKGRTAQAAGQPDTAYAAFQDAVNNYPLAYDAYLSLVELVNAGQPVDELQRGIVDYFAGEYGVSIAAIDRYLSGEPADPASAHYYRGLILRATEDYPGALEEWDQVIQNYPESPRWDQAWEQKAYTQWAYQDDYEAGRQTLEDFVTAAPNHPRAAEFLFDAAQVAERNGNLDRAALLWRKVGFDYTASDYAQRGFFLSGITDYRRGDYPTALDDFNRALANATAVEDKAAAMLWIGKTQKALGDNEAAQTTWQNTAALDPTGYYSERARELSQGKTPFAAPDNYALSRDLNAEYAQAEAWMRSTFSLPPETDLSSPGSLASDPRFQRGNEFFRLGLYEQASAEFESLRTSLVADPVGTYLLTNYLTGLGLYRPAILAARQVLDQAGLTDTTTLTAPDLFSHIRFGTFFPDLVIKAAQENGYHPLLAWSLIRQESFFERNAESSAGARGLMQIMPATGDEMAGRMDWPDGFTTSDLDRPLVSINMGLSYLKRQQDYLGGDLLAALAAYNGGAGNASVWQSLANGDPDLFLEVIRLEETRNYIRRIYENYQIYLKLYAHTP
jgi:soluble lytic murein transglycosylase